MFTFGGRSVLDASKPKSDDTSSAERRKRDRIPLFYRVKLRVGLTDFGNCLLKDISSHGARICVDRVVWVPKQFLIECPNGEFVLHVRQIWRRNDEIGLEFTEAPQFPGIS